MRKSRVKFIDAMVAHLPAMEYACKSWNFNVQKDQFGKPKKDHSGKIISDPTDRVYYRPLSHSRRARRRYKKAGGGKAGFMAVQQYIYEMEMNAFYMDQAKSIEERVKNFGKKIKMLFSFGADRSTNKGPKGYPAYKLQKKLT